MSYRNQEIWQLARDVVIEIHRMTMNNLPKYELYEVGSQIRRSSKSTRSNIVEGYGRRRYKAEYIRFLIFAQASNDETIDHLETLFETESLKEEAIYKTIQTKINHLGKKLNNFIQAIERNN